MFNEKNYYMLHLSYYNVFTIRKLFIENVHPSKWKKNTAIIITFRFFFLVLRIAADAKRVWVQKETMVETEW